MDSRVNQKIEQAQEGIVRLHKLDSMIKQLELEQEELISKEKEFKLFLEKENIDVEKLEHKSVTSIFYSILGSLDEHMAKERKEVLEAQLRYDQVVKDLVDIKGLILKLSSERLRYVDCQAEFDYLYAQKKEELMRENGEWTQELLELIDKTNLKKISLKETDEAILAGEPLLDSLNCILSSLESAEGWGTWDLLGGGLISDLAKHSHIDKANAEAENLQRLLRQFKTELIDISINSDIILETDGFSKFADFFFDGLIADWFMQSRINESQESVKNVRSQVISVLKKLEDMKNREIAELDKLEMAITQLIIKA